MNEPARAPQDRRGPQGRTPPFLVFIGTLVLILVPGAFSAVGWQTLTLECVRHEFGQAPSCKVQNGYLFGLFKTPERQVDGVVSVGRHTSLQTDASRAGSRTLISTVRLNGVAVQTPVFETASNVNEGEKEEVLRKVGQFLENRGQPSLQIAIAFGNVFGWLGLPFFLLVLICVFYTAGWYLWQGLRRMLPRPPPAPDRGRDNSPHLS